MKKYFLATSFVLMSFMVLLTQCKKEDLELSGTSSLAGFSFTQAPATDTLPYAYKITFTNTSTDAFQYQWNFGDNTPLSSEKNPVHTYKVGGSYSVTLTSVGKNGNNAITKMVGVTDACQNDFFSKLTGCSFNEWTWSNDGDAIKVLSANAGSVLFAGAAASCQVDDIYKFSADGTFGYNAKAQTFDVQAGYSCQLPKPNAAKYKVVVKAGQQPKIYLDSLSVGTAGQPFIDTTDLVDSNMYKVQNYTATTLTLRATIKGSGGNLIEIKFKKVVELTLADIKNLLNGGSSKSWKLDPASGANAIIVGTEASPSQYFSGGPLDGACQSDDVYTFSSTDKLTYNANGSTFNGANVSPNYNCGADRSYTNIPYTFTATTGGRAGIATIQIPGVPPTIFIGTTDIPAENMYRIIEISATKMTLRAGNGTGTIFQFKFIAL